MGITPKTVSGSISAGASTPLSIVIIWLLEMIPTHTDPYHLVLPALVAGAIASLIAAAASFFGAYFAPRSEPTPEQVVDILQKNRMQQLNAEGYNPPMQSNYSQPTTPL